ncbi:hypothetical protein COV19_06565 [Candidatus Woesearchaeota archaeon CG10_big_fil_rev_8_21_14_0_10_44_13]|nr:MAG: hypothetical protein COV19_06565 [Candidatus Woesearchaeota archaeon CG10_big_fil_rev_8_21_14_0_10_44_13]
MGWQEFLAMLVQEPMLSIILFILPGFIGFITFLWMLPVIEKTTRYRLGNVGWLSILTGSLIWSFIAYYVSLKINSPNQILTNMSISNSLILALISIGVAEGINIFLFILSLLGNLPYTLSDFILFKKVSHNHKKYFSFNRFKRLWKRQKLQKIKGLMIDKRYEEIRNAQYNRKLLNIKLKKGDVFVGKVSKNSADMSFDMSQFKLKTTQGLVVINLTDVDSVIVVN